MPLQVREGYNLALEVYSRRFGVSKADLFHIFQQDLSESECKSRYYTVFSTAGRENTKSTAGFAVLNFGENMEIARISRCQSSPFINLALIFRGIAHFASLQTRCPGKIALKVPNLKLVSYYRMHGFSVLKPANQADQTWTMTMPTKEFLREFNSCGMV